MRGKLHGNLEMLSEVMRYKQHVSLFRTPPKHGNKKCINIRVNHKIKMKLKKHIWKPIT
jgi:hypothetical protein